MNKNQTEIFDELGQIPPLRRLFYGDPSAEK